MKRFLSPSIVTLTILTLALCVPHISHAFFKGELDLTEQQIEALKELRIETRNSITKKVDELLELRAQLEEVILAEVLNEDNVAELTELIQAKQSEITAIITSAKVEASQLLTPEQRELLLELEEECKEKVSEWQEIVKELRRQLKELFDFIR